MNEKVNIQNLIELLVEKHCITPKEAEEFVKTFFAVIEEGLEQDKYVKIKGLGTFKLIGVESRGSIDVNTGERIEIQGHTKVSFTPDSALKELINRPFGHFETVILNENTVLEDTPIEKAGEDELEDVSIGQNVADESDTISEIPSEPASPLIESVIATEKVAKEEDADEQQEEEGEISTTEETLKNSQQKEDTDEGVLQQTDIKENKDGFEVIMDLPGFKKEDVKIQLKNGYLNIQATREEKKDEKDDKGKYVRRERYTGTCNRSFYVGSSIKHEDIRNMRTESFM